MNTQTLEVQALQNKQAVSTPAELNYHGIVKSCAKRKADNGSQFSSTKGKQSLLLVVLDTVRSMSGIAKFTEDGKRTALPDDLFQAAKKAVETFWNCEAQDIVNVAMANDARITVRRGVLMSRIGKGDKIVRSKTDRFTSVYTPEAKEHKLCDLIGLTAAETKLDTMLDQLGKYSREELDTQKRIIEVLRTSVNAKE
jgi:hypothetical protein